MDKIFDEQNNFFLLYFEPILFLAMFFLFFYFPLAHLIGRGAGGKE